MFITFVCKRNVLKVVMRRTDRLYSGIVRTKSSNVTILSPTYYLKISLLTNKPGITLAITSILLLGLSPNPEKASFRNNPKTEDYSLTSVNT